MSGEGEVRSGRAALVRRLVVGTVKAWDEDGVAQWGAAIAYYSAISLGPLVLLAATVLGDLLGSASAERRVLDQVELLAGPRGVELARTVLQEASRPELGSLGAVLSVGLLLFGATAVFVGFQNALNRIWSVEPRGGAVRTVVRARLTAFVVVLSLGGLMVVSVVLGALVAWAGPLLEPLDAILPLVQLADLVTSLLLLWLFVSVVFRVLPDVRITLGDVWLGALVTAVLLVLGKQVLAAFLARNAFASMYGTAGSLLLLLLWVYYSAQVFFVGAEFTYLWAEERGREIEPEEHAVRVERLTRARPSADG